MAEIGIGPQGLQPWNSQAAVSSGAVGRSYIWNLIEVNSQVKKKFFWKGIKSAHTPCVPLATFKPDAVI